MPNERNVEFKRGRVTFFLRTDSTYTENFYKLLIQKGVVFKSSGNKFNSVLSQNSETLRLNITNQLHNSLSENGNIKMHDIYILKYFKSKEHFLENYIAFTISIENATLDISSANLYNLMEKFFELNNMDLGSIDNTNLEDTAAEINCEFYGKYIEYYNESNTIGDETFKNLIEGYRRVEKYNQANFMPTIISDNYQLYLNSNRNICIEHKFEKNFNKELNNICEYSLALAYKNHYQNRAIQLSEVAKNISYEDYEAILNYATDVAQFEATYFFKNPTSLHAYSAFFEKLLLGEMQQELQSSLDRLVQFISLLHNKKESQRVKKEQEEKEITKKLDDVKSQKLNFKLNLIAVIFTVFGSLGVLPSLLEIFK